jgi:ribosomal 50S subunit-recycling heat shock protein
VPDEACRIDVWLWRARFFKTRALAARAVEAGRIRRGRHGETARIDKVSRPLKIGDEVVFAQSGRLVCVTVRALGERRGPPTEARSLYDMSEPVTGVTPLTSGPLD